MSAIARDVVQRLALGRVFLQEGVRLCQLSVDRLSFARGVVCLHDGLELVLLAVAGHVKANVKEKMTLLQYRDLIRGATPALAWPAKDSSLKELNDVRIMVKHVGLCPDRASLGHVAQDAWANGLAITQTYTGLGLGDVWDASTIRSEKVQGFTRLAQEAIESGQWEQALVSAAYAMYHLVERRSAGGLLWRSALVEKAEEPEWNWTRPYSTEYTVTLLSYGVETHKYARFRRVTPEMASNQEGKVVYRWSRPYGHERNWTEENARWCLQFCVECALRIEEFGDDESAPLHYFHCFVDVLSPKGDEVTIWKLPLAKPSPFPFGPTLKPVADREPLLVLTRGQFIRCYVDDDRDDPRELVVMSPGDVARGEQGEVVFSNVGWVAREQITLRREERT